MLISHAKRQTFNLLRQFADEMFECVDHFVILALKGLKSIETVAQRCSVKEVFLEISQNSLENTCAGQQLY